MVVSRWYPIADDYTIFVDNKQVWNNVQSLENTLYSNNENWGIIHPRPLPIFFRAKFIYFLFKPIQKNCNLFLLLLWFLLLL